MSEKLNFFSEEWCAAALLAVNSNDAVYQGFKDPGAFTNRMEFACTDREVVSHVEWDKGKVISWTPPKFDEGDLWVVINGEIANWQRAAAGEEEGGKLLMAGQIKLAKGPMSAAIENAGALNHFLLSWGQVPTDWDI